MATKTYDQLRAALASMWGYENYTDLGTQDQADIDTFIGAAYFDCYVPVDGSRPTWPEKYVTGTLKAPVATTLTLTNGSATVAGYAFEANYLGSFVKIGERFFRYNSTSTLMSPWDLETGNYAATVYHNAYNLPATVVELAGVPELIGIGLLGAIPDPDSELSLRTEPAFDFRPVSAREPFTFRRNQFRQSAYFDTGDPRYYHIDQAAVTTAFAQASRFQVYPLPDAAYPFSFRANIAPAALSSGTDVPVMPFGTVDNILLPIAKERLVLDSNGRRFTGDAKLIMESANRARTQLKNLRRVQRDQAGSFRVAPGW